MTSPFDFVKAIGRTKEDLLKTGDSSAYRPFIVNRSLSFRADGIVQAQMMNERHWLEPDQQFYFLMGTVPASKTFTPWQKAEEEPPELEAVAAYFGYSKRRALEILDLLGPEEIKRIEAVYKSTKQ